MLFQKFCLDWKLSPIINWQEDGTRMFQVEKYRKINQRLRTFISHSRGCFSKFINQHSTKEALRGAQTTPSPPPFSQHYTWFCKTLKKFGPLQHFSKLCKMLKQRFYYSHGIFSRYLLAPSVALSFTPSGVWKIRR